jgi:TatD DNase family protein
MLIDTHAHLNFKAFKNKVDRALAEADSQGITKIVVPGANLQSSRQAVQLAQQYPQIYAAVGIHPVHAGQDLEKYRSTGLVRELKALIQQPKVVAIGEIGLDNYRIEELPHQNEVQKIQQEVFQIQLELALTHKLPLIIHNRQATPNLLTILNSNNLKLLPGFVFHCFEGDPPIWKFVQQYPSGFLGLTANLTYNQKLQAAVKDIPLTKLVLETDSPFLLPKLPGQSFSFPNTPGNVKIVASQLGIIKNVSPEEVARITSQNSQKLFNI